MKSPLILTALALVSFGITSIRASAAYYDFDFSIVADGGDTITGEIEGLEDNATTVPYDIIINSDPSNPAVGAGNYALNDHTVDNNGYTPSPYVDGRFVVANGLITGIGPGDGDDIGAGVDWYKVITSDPYSQIGYEFDSFGSNNGETTTSDPSGNENSDGFAGTTYYPGTLSAVPEPNQWGVGFFLAFAVAASWRRFYPSSRQASF